MTVKHDNRPIPSRPSAKTACRAAVAMAAQRPTPLPKPLLRILPVLLLLFCNQALAQPPAKIAKPLLAQVQRLTELLRDSRADWYPDATMAQRIRLAEDDEVMLVAFSIEGYGGGNNYTQFLAAFSSDAETSPPGHYTLIDVMPIGGKGWRVIEELRARTVRDPKTGAKRIAVPALENTEDDPPNFPSRKTSITLAFKQGRLVELPAPLP